MTFDDAAAGGELCTDPVGHPLTCACPYGPKSPKPPITGFCTECGVTRRDGSWPVCLGGTCGWQRVSD